MWIFYFLCILNLVNENLPLYFIFLKIPTFKRGDFLLFILLFLFFIFYLILINQLNNYHHYLSVYLFFNFILISILFIYFFLFYIFFCNCESALFLLTSFLIIFQSLISFLSLDYHLFCYLSVLNSSIWQTCLNFQPSKRSSVIFLCHTKHLCHNNKLYYSVSFVPRFHSVTFVLQCNTQITFEDSRWKMLYWRNKKYLCLNSQEIVRFRMRNKKFFFKILLFM